MSLAPPTKLSMYRGAHEYALDSGTVLFTTADGPVMLYYLQDTGLAMPPLTRFADRGPAQHGDTDGGFRLDPRTASFIFAVHTPPVATPVYLYQARSLLLSRFSPMRDPVTMQYIFGDGSIRRIQGHFLSGMQFASEERDPYNWFQKFNVDIKMNDPVWYDPTIYEVNVANSLWAGGFSVPLPIPFNVGISTFNTSQAIAYDGTWETYPDIRIYGPVRDPIITHTGLGLTLAFDGVINAGDYWDILLSASPKNIVDQDGASVMGNMLDPNDFNIFRFVPDPDLPNGINVLNVVGDRTTNATKYVVSYKKRYIGV